LSALAATVDRNLPMTADLLPLSDAIRSPAVEAEGEAPSFIVELTHFTGPLDLLLTLLREEQIDIYDIPIARIAEQFLERIRTLRLDEAAEYLEMAARLLRIKAQTLLPRHGGDEPWDDPRAELVRRLLEYQQVREVVDVLESRAEGRRQRFAAPRRPFAVPEQVVVGARRFEAALSDLLSAVDRIVRAVRAPTVHAVVPRALDVPGAIEAARALLAGRKRFRWYDLLDVNAETWQVLSVLLALLELARLGECGLRQSATFGAIEITPLERTPVGDGLVAVESGQPPFDTSHDTTGAAA
jgi:segregation and condensation protein A